MFNFFYSSASLWPGPPFNGTERLEVFYGKFLLSVLLFYQQATRAQTIEGINILVWTAVDYMVSILLIPHPPRMDRHDATTSEEVTGISFS